jgi:plastocyanin
MTRRPVLAALAALLTAAALPAAARADNTIITMPGKYFSPARVTAVSGDVLTFRNADLVTHDVRIADTWDSGPLARFGSWAQAIDRPGAYPFLCTLHPFMNGSLDVYAATLTAPPGQVLAGERVTLTGRTAAGTSHVGVEQSVAGGPWTAVGAGAAPGADGNFSVAVAAVEGASYRIATPAGPGQVVTPRVTAAVDLHVALSRGRRRSTLRVHTMPATTGFVATLELYARWNFRWRSYRHVRLDEKGHATFRIPAARRAYARVTLSRAARGPKLAFSDVVKLWNGRTAQDPDTITPRDGGHGGGEMPSGPGADGGHDGH